MILTGSPSLLRGTYSKVPISEITVVRGSVLAVLASRRLIFFVFLLEFPLYVQHRDVRTRVIMVRTYVVMVRT